MSLLKEGKKKCTVRVGIVDVSGTDLFMTDGTQRVKIRVSEVDNHKVYRELNNQDALDEGFSSLEELQKDLSKYYGKIDPEQPVTVIRFDIAEG
ncbi:MAG: ASCH domain-containing protein [Candidatus Acidiferrales bacterium]